MSDYKRGYEQAKRDAAALAHKMADAASKTLEKAHDVDAAAQFDTANEIAEAIEALTPPERGDAAAATCATCDHAAHDGHPCSATVGGSVRTRCACGGSGRPR
jgi:hypothetical protein